MGVICRRLHFRVFGRDHNLLIPTTTMLLKLFERIAASENCHHMQFRRGFFLPELLVKQSILLYKRTLVPFQTIMILHLVCITCWALISKSNHGPTTTEQCHVGQLRLWRAAYLVLVDGALLEHGLHLSKLTIHGQLGAFHAQFILANVLFTILKIQYLLALPVAVTGVQR